jgi:NAD(P)H-hydrate epimerase
MVQGELEPEHVLELASRARAVVAGPGLGRAPGTSELVDALVRGVEVPLVLDADALFALAGRLETLRERAGPTALTPHAGELGRLLGRESDAIAEARLASVTEAAELSGAAVLLKGPDTLVADNGEPLHVVETPVPQLATAGAGDVLAGAVGALCARGLQPAQALALAAVAHGSAARLAVSEAGGIVATDLLVPLGRLLA